MDDGRWTTEPLPFRQEAGGALLYVYMPNDEIQMANLLSAEVRGQRPVELLTTDL